jgi:hypothetical protein
LLAKVAFPFEPEPAAARPPAGAVEPEEVFRPVEPALPARVPELPADPGSTRPAERPSLEPPFSSRTTAENGALALGFWDWLPATPPCRRIAPDASETARASRNREGMRIKRPAFPPTASIECLKLAMTVTSAARVRIQEGSGMKGV